MRLAGPAPQGDAGFTLIEVMISTALFGLVALAGFALLDSELTVHARTDGRLEALGDLQRAMYVLTADFQQMSDGSFTAGQDGVVFRRAAQPTGGRLLVGYALKGKTLERRLDGARAQTLVAGVDAARWSFYAPGKGWVQQWPPAGDAAATRPTAVSVELVLQKQQGREGGVLRRLVALPAPP